jgi:GNAT superfamily N-acetyltransferase
MSEIRVSAAVPGDVLGLLGLLAEMDRFYGAGSAEPEEARERQVREALFGSCPAGYSLLARDGRVLAGFAAYSFLWPAVGLTRSLYLKELYVGDEYRRAGVGKLLMAALCRVAGERGCSRVEWTTDDDNDGAKAFYTGLGVPVRTSKLFYRVQDGGGFGAPA